MVIFKRGQPVERVVPADDERPWLQLRHSGTLVGNPCEPVVATSTLTPAPSATKMEHMRTATVRDLRNRYTSLLRWIRAGEEVVITRRGKPIARLIPEVPETPHAVDWSQSPAVQRDRSGSRQLSAEESAAILREAGGAW